MSARAPVERATLAILREAQRAGPGGLLSTILHRLVYLADVYVAEETAGQTDAGETWRCLPYGPFTVGVPAALNRLETGGLVHCERREMEARTTEYALYSPRSGATELLRDIQVSPTVALRIGADLKRYARS